MAVPETAPSYPPWSANSRTEIGTHSSTTARTANTTSNAIRSRKVREMSPRPTQHIVFPGGGGVEILLLHLLEKVSKHPFSPRMLLQLRPKILQRHQVKRKDKGWRGVGRSQWSMIWASRLHGTWSGRMEYELGVWSSGYAHTRLAYYFLILTSVIFKFINSSFTFTNFLPKRKMGISNYSCPDKHTRRHSTRNLHAEVIYAPEPISRTNLATGWK